MSDQALTDPILTSTSEQILTITINRPEARNALRVSDKRRMTEIITEVDADIRCIVITSSGNRAFCAGSDLKEMAGMGIPDFVEMEIVESTLLDAIMKSRVPVIAAVRGWALGTGCALASVCDLLFAEPSARFGQPEILNGAPTPIHGALLPSIIGLNRARWLVLTGQTIDAILAEKWGLVDQVTAEGEALSAATAMAIDLAATTHPESMALQKRIVDSWVRYPFDAAVSGSMFISAASYGSGYPQSAAERMHDRNLRETGKTV